MITHGSLSVTGLADCADYLEKSMERMISVPGGKVWAKVVGEAPGIPLFVLHGGPGMPSDYLNSLTVLADERPVAVPCCSRAVNLMKQPSKL